MFFLHSGSPTGVRLSATEGLRHRREARRGRGRASCSRSWTGSSWGAGWPLEEQQPHPWVAVLLVQRWTAVLLVQQRRTVHQGLLVQQLMQQPGQLGIL